MNWRRVTTVCAIFWIAGILTGCATNTTPPEFEVPEVERSAVEPLRSCEWPTLTEHTGSVEIGRDALRVLLECREIAEGNAEIAAGNAESVRELSAAYSELRLLRQRERELARWQRERLERDIRHARIENWLIKGLLVIGAAGSL